jgi:type I restriction enzyme M protein
VSRRISQQQLESYLWGAATLLRGTIDAGDYKQFIFPLLFYKRVCDVFDEETQAALKESGGDVEFAQYPENHRFQVPSDAHWSRARHTPTNVGRGIQQGMRAIETENPDKLFGIFGDAQWTNKDRLSDAMLRDLVEHFSTLDLTLANLPEDELGQGYEYLIKKFADDAGHTAAEFYTNRTVVHLMTEMLKPEPGESIYDPTCGSGGMLLSCITHLRRQGKEWRNVRLYGQERNLMTSSIARMNCFLHGIEDFRIERGDTLSEPKFVEGDRLMQFDVVLANPPYSIKQWDRDAFASDPWGRNLYGTPPQGRADYAFWQHILCSLKSKTGRCAILFPHGVLFRQEEKDMRRKLVEADLIECVLGLGPNLFYNSPMEACVVICRTGKPKGRKGRILFINAVNEVTRERAQSFLTDDHIEHIAAAYQKFKNEAGFASVATIEEVRLQGGNLNIPMYVATAAPTTGPTVATTGNSVVPSLAEWLTSGAELRAMLDRVFEGTFKPPELPASTVVSTLPQWLTRTEWRRLPFGAFADRVNQRIEPSDAAEEIYVGLDDLDSGALHIRRWGTGSDVIGTKLRFRKGDIIFGRRRAYQRKLAVAEMDGICSAHAMVVRAKPDVVLPDFLPFLMMSDRFMNRAVEISVGSLSPTINWTTLKLEEFDLPPLDQQRRIADILWATDEAETRLRAMLHATDNVVSATRSQVPNGNYPKKPLADIATVITKGESPGWQGFKYQDDGAVFVTSENVLFGRYESEPRKHIPMEFHHKLRRSALRKGDVLFNLVGASIGRGCVLPEIGKEANVNQAVAVVRLDEATAKPQFILAHLLSPNGLKDILGTAVNTARANVSLDSLRKTLIPLPPIAVQAELCGRLNAVDAAKASITSHLEALCSMRRAFLNQLVYPS